MNLNDKNEFVKIMGEVLEQNVFPAIDELREDIKKDISGLAEKINRID